MQLTELLDTDRGVSPVIGVILMVAITVILAAVIGTFVLDIGGSLSSSAPSATWETEQASDGVDAVEDSVAGGTQDGQTVNLTYTGGEEVMHENLNATINGDQAYAVDDEGSHKASDSDPNVAPLFNDDGPVEITATWSIIGYDSDPPGGSSPNVDTASDIDNALSQGDTLRITWNSGEGQSQILFEYEIRDIA